MDKRKEAEELKNEIAQLEEQIIQLNMIKHRGDEDIRIGYYQEIREKRQRQELLQSQIHQLVNH